METNPRKPLVPQPADPRLPSVRACAPADRAELHRTAGPVPTQQIEPDGQAF